MISMLSAGQVAQASLFSGIKGFFNKKSAAKVVKSSQSKPVKRVLSWTGQKRAVGSKKVVKNNNILVEKHNKQQFGQIHRETLRSQAVLSRVLMNDLKREMLLKNCNKMKTLKNNGKDLALHDERVYSEAVVADIYHDVVTANPNKSARQNLLDFDYSNIVADDEQEQMYPMDEAGQLLLRTNLLDEYAPSQNMVLDWPTDEDLAPYDAILNRMRFMQNQINVNNNDKNTPAA